MTPILLLAAAYFMGAIPTSYIVGKLTRGIDLRQHGSGNLGATNAYRVLGWKAATPIFIVDIAKGFVPVYLFPQIDGSNAAGWALAYGAVAIFGHVFSIYVGFRGGKGVATGAGVFLALAPLAVLAGLIVWAALAFGTGYVSLASIAAVVVLPIAVAFTVPSRSVLLLALGLAIFVIWAHRANVKRLLRGEEHRFKREPPQEGESK